MSLDGFEGAAWLHNRYLCRLTIFGLHFDELKFLIFFITVGVVDYVLDALASFGVGRLGEELIVRLVAVS